MTPEVPSSAERAARQPASSPDSTRQRIVAAALQEFSRNGIAGARVDRIAKQARTSKERVYTYFRSKEDLYAQTAVEELARVAEATSLDPYDLPGYAGRLFDHFEKNPAHHRLVSWGRLELDEAAADATSPTTGDPVPQAIQRKVRQVQQCQQEGGLDPAWDPIDVLALVSSIATTWVVQPELTRAAGDLASDASPCARRAVVVDAVARLFPRATDAGAKSTLVGPAEGIPRSRSQSGT